MRERLTFVLIALMGGALGAGAVYATRTPLTAPELSVDSPEPLSYQIRGIIRDVDHDAQSLLVDTVSRYSIDSSVPLTIHTTSSTTITTNLGETTFSALRPGDAVTVTLPSRGGTLFARVIVKFTLTI